MPFLKVRDINIHYQIKGQGPKLLYISGTGGDLRKQPSILDSVLSDHFQVLAYDQRGMGQSSKPDEAYSMEGYADDAAALVAAVGWQSCHVIGFSFGGMVAQHLALRHSQLVKRLILSVTTSGGAGGSSYPMHQLSHLSIKERATRMLELSDLRRNQAWREEHPKFFEAMLEQTIFMLEMGANEPGHAIGAKRQLEARQFHDTYDLLPQLEMPMLVCGGKYDGLAPPDSVRNLADRIPNSKLSFYEGGHLFHLQDRQGFKDMIAFLNQN